ncbi:MULTISPECIES: DUF3515 family protein [Kocuria]|uniref:DUF3515 family protein n=1 Tax=Kocuria TaxID=57493 RepID=UPI0006AA2F5A|nr:MULTISPECIES: DUF3515 family protein [Kocuria]ALB02940.1 hypothetical protein KPaMU14_04480 [Kocuria palustris]KUG54906.1 hypothetical protein AVL60_00695 [Kocuria palustris]
MRSGPNPLLPLRAAALTAAGLVLLTGCGSSTAQVEAAEDAANPECAPAMLAMPEQISGQDQRQTSSQGTTAYGDPSAAVVRCGVTPPEPTTDLCTRVNGVDWLIRDLESDNRWQATTYGRDPAFEITFDTTVVPSSTALVDLGSAVSTVPQDSECLSVDEVPQT